MAADKDILGGAFAEGVDAHAGGRALADNPYDPASPEGREWAAGLAATPDLDEEDDPLSNRLHKEDEVAPGGPGGRRRGI